MCQWRMLPTYHVRLWSVCTWPNGRFVYEHVVRKVLKPIVVNMWCSNQKGRSDVTMPQLACCRKTYGKVNGIGCIRRPSSVHIACIQHAKNEYGAVPELKEGGGGIHEKTRRPTASSGTIPPCESPVTRPGIKPDSLEAANRSAAEKRSSSKRLMKTVLFERETTEIGTRSKFCIPCNRGLREMVTATESLGLALLPETRIRRPCDFVECEVEKGAPGRPRQRYIPLQRVLGRVRTQHLRPFTTSLPGTGTHKYVLRANSDTALIWSSAWPGQHPALLGCASTGSRGRGRIDTNSSRGRRKLGSLLSIVLRTDYRCWSVWKGDFGSALWHAEGQAIERLDVPLTLRETKKGGGGGGRGQIPGRGPADTITASVPQERDRGKEWLRLQKRIYPSAGGKVARRLSSHNAVKVLASVAIGCSRGAVLGRSCHAAVVLSDHTPHPPSFPSRKSPHCYRLFTDKIGVQHVYTDVTFAIGSQFIKHALDGSEPIADLQGNK
ncbi:hypothetical protein PR048_022202 [Dryococelus australis]|uniref:Uncharacterized protein n=1 Tax=Dryococelus australis TaxID=614101 RepID=A0ABQ9H0H1_9NEOP|nr:hypothetical protein PR048_022202 [Dryococelus australis]